MTESSKSSSLALETSQAVRITGEQGRQDLEGDIAAELRIVRGIHFAHSARAEHRSDFVRAETPANERGGCHQFIGRGYGKNCMSESLWTRGPFILEYRAGNGESKRPHSPAEAGHYVRS